MARTAPVPNIPPIPGMCPSIAVMGGGAGGGGGSGDGAGDGDGNGPADGDGNGDGANGDGSGAGACGNGANGSCTNCSSGAAAGDPVDVVTGEVFTVAKTDLFLPGFFNLELSRRYSSSNRAHDVGLGWGWTHSFAWSLWIKRDRIAVRSGLGQVVEFPKLEAAGESSRYQGWGLLRTAEGFWLRAGNEFHHRFEQDDTDPTHYRLREIRFRNRPSVHFEYRNGALARIVDTAGRSILFGQTPEGQIASITVPDQAGSSITFARYAYDGGHLVLAEDADGNRFRYAYDDARRLIRMELPNGVLFHFNYDRKGRCVETWGERPDGADMGLDPSLSPFLADGVTKARGIYHVKLDFGADGYTEVVDSARVQRFFGERTGVVTKGIDGRGGVTTRKLDQEGLIAAQTDANGATWTYQYDHLGNVTRQEDPEGHALKYERDEEGRELKVINPEGGVVTFSRDRNGDVEWMTDPRGGLRRYRRNDRGQVVEEGLPDGTRWLFEYDAHGNRTAVTSPAGGVSRFWYDFWGRRTREQEIDGRITTYQYSNAGRLVVATDAIGRTKAYAYDAFGNVTLEKLPDGSACEYAYGGLGWLTHVTHPTGDTIRAYYNREGWVLRLVNEKGETWTFERNATGMIAAETMFDGSWRRYTRDPRGFVTAITDARGKTAIERNKLGQIVKQTGPDGEERELAYDARGELVRAKAGGVELLFERDPMGEVIRERVTAGQTSYEVASDRDIMGRRIGFKTSVGHQVEVRRQFGRVGELWADGAQVVGIDRDSTGWPIRRALPRGGAIVDELDAVGRTRRRFVESNAVASNAAEGPAWVGGPRRGSVDKTYAYTPVDEIATITTAADGTTEFEYDLRRHMLEKRNRTKSESFRYDQAGKPYEAGGNGQAPLRQYSDGGRLAHRGNVDYEYDARGRLVAKITRGEDGSRNVTRFEYDAWNMLRAVALPNDTRVEFQYDPFARRVEKRVLERGRNGKHQVASTTRYVWDLVSVVHEIHTDKGTTPRVNTYLYEGNDTTLPIAQRRSDSGQSGEWQYIVGDINDTPEEIVDASGRTLASSAREAYGSVSWTGGSTTSTPFRFPGQIADPETGLHYNRYRYYDPETGRYLTPDPIGLEGSVDLYEYGPNPIVWIDPMGWEHGVTGTLSGGGFPEPRSVSGVSGFDGCPACLRTQPHCHSERRLLHELENNDDTRGRLEGAQLDLTARPPDGLPPCPQCHRAMHDFAQRHGTTITYTYGDQTITYAPGSHPTAPEGSHAANMLDGYGPMNGPLRPVGSGIGGHDDGGARSGTSGAPDRYPYAGPGRGTAYTREADRVVPTREGAERRRLAREAEEDE